MDDRDLIEALRRGDPAAWREFLDRYLKLACHVVRRTLQSYLGRADEHDVDDIVYEIWQVLVKEKYRALAAIGAPYDLKAFLAVSARRKAIDFVRRRKPTLSIDRALGEEGDESFAARMPDAREEAPAADPAEVRALGEAMKRLGSRERLMVRMFYQKGLKYREIARATGVPMNSIGPTLQRAVEKLRELVKKP